MVENSGQTSREAIKDLVLNKLADAGDGQPEGFFESSDDLDAISKELSRLQRRLEIYREYTLDVYVDAYAYERCESDLSMLDQGSESTTNPFYLRRMGFYKSMMTSISSGYAADGSKNDFAILFEAARTDIRSLDRIVNVLG